MQSSPTLPSQQLKNAGHKPGSPAAYVDSSLSNCDKHGLFFPDPKCNFK